MHCFGIRLLCSDRYRESNQHASQKTHIARGDKTIFELGMAKETIIFISKYGFVQSYILQMKANRCITPPSKTIENLSWQIVSFTNREKMHLVTQLNSQLSANDACALVHF